MKAFLLNGAMILALLLSVFAFNSVSQADNSIATWESFQLAQQGKTCQNFNEVCGIPAGVGGGPTACCQGLWCQNGSCKYFGRANEPCGSMADVPCGPGLGCVAGRCK